MILGFDLKRAAFSFLFENRGKRRGEAQNSLSAMVDVALAQGGKFLPTSTELCSTEETNQHAVVWFVLW